MKADHLKVYKKYTYQRNSEILIDVYYLGKQYGEHTFYHADKYYELSEAQIESQISENPNWAKKRIYKIYDKLVELEAGDINKIGEKKKPSITFFTLPKNSIEQHGMRFHNYYIKHNKNTDTQINQSLETDLEVKDRIEVQMEVHKTAIHIAQLYGRMGAELFDSLFLPLAKEYAKSVIDKEKDLDNPKFLPSQIE